MALGEEPIWDQVGRREKKTAGMYAVSPLFSFIASHLRVSSFLLASLHLIYKAGQPHR